MKKQLLFTPIVLSMIFCSCSKTIEIDSDLGKSGIPVIFDSRMVETRAQDKTAWELNDKINIWVYDTSGTGSGWANSSVSMILKTAGWEQPTGADLMWPDKGTLSFLSFFPYTVTPIISGSDISIDWTVDNNVDNQKDLLWASVVDADMDNASGTKKNATGKIPTSGGGATQLQFVHALSKIEFKVEPNATVTAGDKIVVLSLTINNVKLKAKGKVTEALDSIQWACENTPLGNFDVMSDTLILESTTDLKNQYLFIPQKSSDLKLTLKYSSTVNDIRKVYTKVYTIGSWEANKRNIYKFSISSGRVIFNPIITDWDDNEVAL